MRKGSQWSPGPVGADGRTGPVGAPPSSVGMLSQQGACWAQGLALKEATQGGAPFLEISVNVIKKILSPSLTQWPDVGSQRPRAMLREGSGTPHGSLGMSMGRGILESEVHPGGIVWARQPWGVSGGVGWGSCWTQFT